MSYKGIGNRLLRNVISHPGVYGFFLGIVVGLSSSFGTYRPMDNMYVKPRSATIELNRRVGNAFGEIAHIYYDPTITIAHNVLFYNNSPQLALKRLQDTKEVVNNNRQFLSETGNLGKLPENQLDLAIERVQSFVHDYPQNSVGWYAYLYAGDGNRPPATYAQELRTFYETVEKQRIYFNSTPSARKDLRNALSVICGVATMFISWFGYPFIHTSFKNRYVQSVTEGHLQEKLGKIRAFQTQMNFK